MIGYSGIGAHIAGLLEGWREIAPDFRPTLIGDPATLAEWVPDVAKYPIVPSRAPVYGLREQLIFPAGRTRGALLHCPHYNIALRHAGPLVVTIHDLIHLDKRCGPRPLVHRVYARWMLPAAARRARHIFAVSRATADDLVARFGVARDKITVAHNAPARIFLQSRACPETIRQFRRKLDLPADYLLTVGLYKPHKNLDLLFEAFKSLRESRKTDMALVVAGTQEKERPALKNRLAQLGISDHVRVLDWLPAAQLPLLYAGATALIHPALLEGFGLPIVEAQAVGTPVVASRASAVPEVAGEGALFFDPRDAADLARQILALIGDNETRDRLIAAGHRNIERFSWRESARKVLEAYEQVARAPCP
jgi:glycosyltransferase involved in cell wall biosynthesis